MDGAHDGFPRIQDTFQKPKVSTIMRTCGINVKPPLTACPPLLVNLRTHLEPIIHQKLTIIMKKVRERQRLNNVNVKQLQLLFIILSREDTAL